MHISRHASIFFFAPLFANSISNSLQETEILRLVASCNPPMYSDSLLPFLIEINTQTLQYIGVVTRKYTTDINVKTPDECSLEDWCSSSEQTTTDSRIYIFTVSVMRTVDR